jgi:hypothetical protein
MSLDNVKHLTIGGKNAIRLELGGGVVWKGLPAGYKRLDYIEVTGTQYIDTGFIANQDTRLVCRIRQVGTTMHVLGARQAVATRNFSIRVVSKCWQIGYDSDGGVTTGPIAVKDDWQTVEINKNSLYVDGEFSVSRAYVAFKTPQTLTLGAIKAGASSPTMYYGTAKYRECQIYDNGVLIRDFIPCQNPDGKAGMYDLLNAKFYGNAGSGEFVKGAEV